jgi:hypothetical protein
MEKKLGRPRREKGMISFWNFQRGGIAMSSYDEARKNGEKHSAAVAQTVEFIKQYYPMMRISETEVKRTLAAWRPRRSHTILRIECSTIVGEEVAKPCLIEAQLAAMAEKKEAKLPVPSDVILPKSITTYKMYFGERPNYPRHNRKLPR